MAEQGVLSLTRLIALATFVSRNPGCTVGDIASHFERSLRQVRRDLTLIMDAGFGDLLPGNTLELDLDAYQDRGVLILRTPLGLEKTAVLSKEELSLMLYGLYALTPSMTPEERATLPQTISTLYHLTNMGDGEQVELPSLDIVALVDTADRIHVIRQALTEKRVLLVDYTRADGNRRERPVVPLALNYEKDGWVLEGLSLDVGETRSFRLDRMNSVRKTADAGVEPEVATGRGLSDEPDRGRPVRVFLDRAAAWLADESSGEYNQGSDGEVTLDFTVWDEDWMRTELLLVADHVQRSEPSEVKEGAARFAAGALRVWNDIAKQIGTQ